MVDYYYTNAVMGERPEVINPNKEFLEQLTVAGFTKMIDEFYGVVLDSEIAHFFPDDVAEIELIKKKKWIVFYDALWWR